MSGIQPSRLSNEELIRYAWLLEQEIAQDETAKAWIRELAKRLEKAIHNG